MPPPPQRAKESKGETWMIKELGENTELGTYRRSQTDSGHRKDNVHRFLVPRRPVTDKRGWIETNNELRDDRVGNIPTHRLFLPCHGRYRGDD